MPHIYERTGNANHPEMRHCVAYKVYNKCSVCKSESVGEVFCMKGLPGQSNFAKGGYACSGQGKSDILKVNVMYEVDRMTKRSPVVAESTWDEG